MARRSRRAVALAAVATMVAVVAVVVLTVGDVGAPTRGTAVGGEAATGGTAPAAPTGAATSDAPCAPEDRPPVQVDVVATAVAALEDELGGPAAFFEINATPALVNLFVAGRAADGTQQVTPYVFVDGALRAEQPRPAEGIAFPAAALTFDPARVLSCVTAELAESTVVVFFAQGAASGEVKLSVLLESRQGGQLLVDVAPDGQVLAVDALEPSAG